MYICKHIASKLVLMVENEWNNFNENCEKSDSAISEWLEREFAFKFHEKLLYIIILLIPGFLVLHASGITYLELKDASDEIVVFV